jgi:hypothetical protein
MRGVGGRVERRLARVQREGLGRQVSTRRNERWRRGRETLSSSHPAARGETGARRRRLAADGCRVRGLGESGSGVGVPA